MFSPLSPSLAGSVLWGTPIIAHGNGNVKVNSLPVWNYFDPTRRALQGGRRKVSIYVLLSEELNDSNNGCVLDRVRLEPRNLDS